MCFDDDYIPQYYDLNIVSGDENMQFERQVDTEGNSVKRNQDSFLGKDSYNFLHKRKEMEVATTLNDKRANIPRKRSSGKKHRRNINETGIAGGLTENTFPVTNIFSEAVNTLTGENSLSLVKLEKLVRQFEINFENKEVLATKMKEVNSINLQQIKNVQAAIDSMRPSSDSVGTLTGIIKEQSNIIAGLSLTIDTTNDVLKS